MSASVVTARFVSTVVAALSTLVVQAVVPAVVASADTNGGVAPNAFGMLDCNGFSPIQKSIKASMVCSDPRSLYDGQPARFYDNGHYIGHDEPSIRFLSNVPGSANNVTWNEQLPRDPSAAPTVNSPGSDTTNWFELSVAPWFGMALCDPYSFPQTACQPESDTNAPKNPPTFNIGGGGSSFLEVQFYPPGFAPFVDNISCDNTHWCASLHINDLECTTQFRHCNNNCIEPTNFAFIQQDGVPTGPPSPQLANLSTSTPNTATLLMNPGDKLSVHLFDANLAGGGRALEVHISDLSTGQSGFMQASAANGFMATIIGNCHGVPFNYEPEYNTAQPQNLVPWAALQGGILTQYEIGHFTPCQSVSDPATFSFGSFSDTFFQTCAGPYEAATIPDTGTNPEGGDLFCFPAGDTHGGTAPPNRVTGCTDLVNGDLDFDGTPYWADWPNSTTPNTFPSTFLQQQPTSGGAAYSGAQFETDAAASESTCGPATLSGCAVPAPGSPGNFYPYWTQASVGGHCVWEFGQMPNGNAFGGAAQYDGPSAYFFGTLSGPISPSRPRSPWTEGGGPRRVWGALAAGSTPAPPPILVFTSDGLTPKVIPELAADRPRGGFPSPALRFEQRRRYPVPNAGDMFDLDSRGSEIAPGYFRSPVVWNRNDHVGTVAPTPRVIAWTTQAVWDLLSEIFEALNPTAEDVLQAYRQGLASGTPPKESNRLGELLWTVRTGLFNAATPKNSSAIKANNLNVFDELPASMGLEPVSEYAEGFQLPS